MSNRIQLCKKIKEKLETGDIEGMVNLFRTNPCKIDSRGLELHDMVISDIDFFDMFNNGSMWVRNYLSNIKFSDSEFRGSIFRDTTFENVIFENSSLVGTKFINSKFKNVKFLACNMSGADFDKLAETDIEFNSCNLYNTGLNGEKYLDRIKSNNIMDYINKIISKCVSKNILIIPIIFYIFTRLLFNCDIPLHSIKVGKNCCFSHLGFGTIIAGGCKIGNNVWIGPKVNIFGRRGIVPVIGDNVVIGIGSTIAANIGDNAIIGAGSLVFDDVPNNQLVIGEKAAISL